MLPDERLTVEKLMRAKRMLDAATVPDMFTLDELLDETHRKRELEIRKMVLEAFGIQVRT